MSKEFTYRVLIIGGGVAALRCASLLEAKKIEYLLLERESKVGGHVAQWNTLFPEGIESAQLINSPSLSINPNRISTNKRAISINKRDGQLFETKTECGRSYLSNSVIVATGFELFDASLKEEYGYSLFPGVITNANLEELFVRPKELMRMAGEKIAFLHCVGSRDSKSNNMGCSKVCCITAVKQALKIKELLPHSSIWLFYMDLRMFGRGYEELYLKAQKEGVRFVRGRVSEVSQNHKSELTIKAEDTLISKPIKLSVDMLVLMSGMVSDKSNLPLLKSASVKFGKDGFIDSPNLYSLPSHTSVEGLFSVGAVNGPKTIPELMGEAAAAICEVEKFLKERSL
ncbi:MAG: FAD-dependent oxidoreductase [Bacteroidales bacterium]